MCLCQSPDCGATCIDNVAYPYAFEFFQRVLVSYGVLIFVRKQLFIKELCIYRGLLILVLPPANTKQHHFPSEKEDILEPDLPLILPDIVVF